MPSFPKPPPPPASKLHNPLAESTNVVAAERSAVTSAAAVLEATDHYAIFGLQRGKVDNLVPTYRRIALVVHPDKCADERAEEAFMRLRQAFSILSDRELRKFYDEELQGCKKRGKVAQTQAGRVAEEQRRQAYREKVQAMVAALSRERPQSPEFEQAAARRAVRDAQQREAIRAQEEARAEAAAARQKSMAREARRISKRQSHLLHLPTSQALAHKARHVAPSERGRRRDASLSLLGDGFGFGSQQLRRTQSAGPVMRPSSGGGGGGVGGGAFGVGSVRAEGMGKGEMSWRVGGGELKCFGDGKGGIGRGGVAEGRAGGGVADSGEGTCRGTRTARKLTKAGQSARHTGHGSHGGGGVAPSRVLVGHGKQSHRGCK